MFGPSDSAEFSKAGCVFLAVVMVLGVVALASIQIGGAWLVEHFH